MRSSLAFGAFLAAGVVVSVGHAREASACGGAFSNPNENDAVVTDHRMILSVSQQQTTLYDEIEFTGEGSSFAWVLPIKGAATVGLSADLLFATLDTLTAPQVQPPSANCAPPPSCDLTLSGPTAEEDAGAGGGVMILSQAQVGPYATVQLSSSDPTALSSWLSANGFNLPASANPVISAYVSGGFDFLAIKLAPGASVGAMRPIRVTTQGASLTLPLRMVSVGTGATTGITLWVIGDGRYAPQNFPSFILQSSDLVWDWTTGMSNYDAVRTSKEAALNGAGWQIESSLELAQSTVISDVESGSTFPGFPVQPADGVYLGTVPTDGGVAVAPDASSDASFGDAGDPADQARAQDLTTLFAGISGPNARITRMRSDISQAALASDLTLEASTDPTELSNVYTTSSAIGSPSCPTYPACVDSGTSSGSGAGSGKGSTSGSGSASYTGSELLSPPGGSAASSSSSAATPESSGCSATGNGSGPYEPWAFAAAALAFVGVGARRKRARR